MTRRFYLHLLGPLICAAVAGCGAAREPAALGPAGGSVDDAGAGRFLERTYTADSGVRNYRLYLPTRYDPRRPLPLVVMLHGCAQHAADIAAGTRLNELADEFSFLVAYPEQPASANPQRCWNWYQAEHRGRERGEASLIAGIAREVMAGYEIDPRRVYVAGISAGGAMALIQAATNPDLYAAVASHSGIMFGAADNVEQALGAMQGRGLDPQAAGDAAYAAMGPQARPVPAILFQGAADPLVNAANVEAITAHWVRTLQRAGLTISETPTAQEVVERNGRRATRALFRDAAGTVMIERWIVDGLGHAWSGGAADGSFTDVRGPDASREMIRFFLEPAPR